MSEPWDARHGVRPEALTAPELVPLDTLERFPGNAREHDDDVLDESLTTHGLYQPIVVQRSTRYIVLGNGRYETALRLGWSHIAVQWLDCTDDEALAINLMDNASSDRAQQNPADLLAQLDRLDGRYVGTGYSERDRDRLARQMDEPLRFADELPRTGAGLREALLVLPEADHAELMRLFDAIRQRLGEMQQGAVALLAARVAVAVLDGGAGHRPSCDCTWCTIARQAGATERTD